MVEDNPLKYYRELNSSFKRNLIYNIGTDAGFFSEYNNMVLAILYCLERKIKFSLYSKTANFAFEQGWNDFFYPFCDESHFILNNTFNKRPYQVNSNKAIVAKGLKSILGTNFFTQDLWDLFRSGEFANTKFNVPELKLKGASLLEASTKINSIIWKYNKRSAEYINYIKNSVNIPQDYVSIHIRSGDKYKEAAVFSLDQYMEFAIRHSHNKVAFISTDDYSNIEELRAKYVDWTFLSLCSPSERGYFQQDFNKKEKLEKYLHHLKLFASLDICAKSSKFIGTISSNIGMFIGMRLEESKCLFLDSDSWRIG